MKLTGFNLTSSNTATELKRYLKVYFLFTQAAFNQTLLTRFSSIIFLIGKIIRFLFSFFLIILIVGKTQKIAGYNLNQVILFFLIFNLIDMLAQVLLRGVYWFRGTIITGSFDFYLLKPLNPLFRSLFCFTDLLDLVTLIPLIIYLLNFISKNNFISSFTQLIIFLLLFINACLIVFSFHIVVLGIGVLTTEVDHAIWLYRDLSGMLRIPIEIYNEPIQFFLTFIVPVVVATNFPAKMLLGLLSWQWILYSFLITYGFLFTSLKFWHYSLRQYTSASS